MKIANLSIELTKLKSGIAKTPKGTECIFIQIDQPGINISKDGTRAFLNLAFTMFDTPNEQGNDVSAYHRETKEERESKLPKKYLGSGKVVFDSNNKPVKPSETLETDSLNNPNEIDLLPF